LRRVEVHLLTYLHLFTHYTETAQNENKYSQKLRNLKYLKISRRPRHRWGCEMGGDERRGRGHITACVNVLMIVPRQFLYRSTSSVRSVDNNDQQAGAGVGRQAISSHAGWLHGVTNRRTPAAASKPGASKGTPGDAKCVTEILGGGQNKEVRGIIKTVATICHILRLKCTKFDLGCIFAPNPAGGAHSAPQDPQLYLRGSYF